MQSNYDRFRAFGELEIGVHFQVIVNNRSEIYKTNTDSQPVHLLTDCEPALCIAKVRNECPELLYLVNTQKELQVFNTEYVSEVKGNDWL